MSKNVIDSLKVWDRDAGGRQRRQGVIDIGWSAAGRARVVCSVPVAYPRSKFGQAPTAPLWAIHKHPAPSVAAKTAPVASCVLLKFDGDTAECCVTASGFEVPRAGLPAWVLRGKGLKPGDRFLWTMTNEKYVYLNDIDVDISRGEPRLSNDDERLLEDLHRKSLERRAADPADWPEYTGPG